MLATYDQIYLLMIFYKALGCMVYGEEKYAGQKGNNITAVMGAFRP
jgi:hypothetical protein